ncbi:MAG: ABC transporter substrate-binding protein [Pseudomonadota bacterium]
MFRRSLALLGALAALSTPPAAAQEGEPIRIGFLASNEGEVAPISIAFNDGLADYFTLLNVRDGGVEGRPLEIVACETGYTMEGHVACYQEIAGAGAVFAIPSMTEGAYAVNRIAPQVGVPTLNGGLGQTAAANGEVFPLSFAFPANYLQAASVMVNFLDTELEGLAGKRIAFVYHDSAFGTEPIPLLEALAAREGFTLDLYPVAPPGEDQAAVWGRVAASGADQAILWTVGRMTGTAIGTAAAVGYPRERMLGIWWTTPEPLMRALGPAAEGMRAVSFMSVGFDVPAYNALNEIVYFGGRGHGQMDNVGHVDYNRGLMTGVYMAEAVRAALAGDPAAEMTPARMVAGLESLDLSAADLQALGLGEYVAPITLSCADHGGYGGLRVIRWSARSRVWENASDFIEAERALVDGIVARQAAGYAEAVGITPRSCS